MNFICAIQSYEILHFKILISVSNDPFLLNMFILQLFMYLLYSNDSCLTLLLTMFLLTIRASWSYKNKLHQWKRDNKKINNFDKRFCARIRQLFHFLSTSTTIPPDIVKLMNFWYPVWKWNFFNFHLFDTIYLSHILPVYFLFRYESWIVWLETYFAAFIDI